MFNRFQPLRGFFFASLTMMAAAEANAELAKNSPFLPVPVAAPAAGPTAGAPLEFRGYIDVAGEGQKVRIYDPNRKIGAWLKVNERDPAYDFVVKQYDPARDTVSVEFRGQTLVLAQREGKVTSSGVMAQNVPMVAAGIPMPAAVTNTVAVNPTPAQEAQRLEAVAAEVARRRQLREQASDQLVPGVPNQVQPQVIQPQPSMQPPAAQPNQNNAQRGGRGGPGGAAGAAGRRGQ